MTILKNSNEILKNKENKIWLFISCLSRFDIPDIDSLILIQGDSVSSNHHLYGGRRHIFDWPTQHPTVTWATLCSPLFGALFPFFFFYLVLLKLWGVESWGERKKEGGVTMANISVGWGRTLQHKWHMFRLYVCLHKQGWMIRKNEGNAKDWNHIYQKKIGWELKYL